MTDNPTDVSPDVQDLVKNYNEGTKESLDEAMNQIRKWLIEDSTMARNKISEALEKYDVGLKDITQAWGRSNRQDESTTSDQLQIKWIGMPFFSFPLNKPTGGERMSGSVSVVARADLANFLKFEVRFEDGEESIKNDIKSIGLPQISSSKKRQFLDAIADMLEKSADFDAEGEIQQLQQYADAIKRVLRVHGYDVKVKSPPAEDFSFYEGETALISGEAKKADKLPNRKQPSGTSVELCWFGFASFICRSPHKNLSITAKLRNLLGVGEPPNPGKTPIILHQCSSLVRNIIEGKNDDAARIRNIAPSIKAKLRDKVVDPDDALSIWGAVMQACCETVPKGKQYSIVMSLKMMWFLRLGLDKTDRCIVSITDGIQVGSEDANSNLLKFLTYVKDKTMDDETQRKWQDAIAKPLKKKAKSSSDKPKKGGEAPPSKHPKLDKEGGGKTGPTSGGSHKTSSLSSRPNLLRAVTFDSLDDVQGTDENGIPIPYFDQIRDTVQDLGCGRCGTVRKVRWKDSFAAVKGFRHKGEDDHRLPYDIYEHELSVLRSLERLWGIHVPRLLFHKPWPSNPTIGLQVGEPMPEDMDSWTGEERNRAELSLEEIRKFGWVQHDRRGSNFVRLTRKDGSWSIAAIDLESMVWTK